MNNDERTVLVETARFVHQLSLDRNDMLIGLTAALLDIYRTSFRGGTDTKQDALARLELQRQQLSRIAGGPGTTFLKYLADNLETDNLDAAKLYRDFAAGTA